MEVCLKVNWKDRVVCISEPQAPPVMRFRITLDSGINVEGEDMNVTLTDVQKFSAAIAATDAKGNPAKLDGVPVWTVSDPALLLLTVEADGLSASVAAAGPLGVGQVTVTADADLGAGARDLVGILDVEVVGSDAVALDFKVTAPEAA